MSKVTLETYGFPASYNKSNKEDVLNFLLNYYSDQSHYLMREKGFSSQFIDLYNDLLKWSFPDSFTFSQKLYHFLHNDTHLKLGYCEICNKRCNFKNITSGYCRFCPKCIYKSSERNSKISIGRTSYWKNIDFNEKERQINLIKSTISNKTIEEKAQISKKMLITKSQKSNDDKKMTSLKMSNSQKNRWRNKSEEEMKIYSENVKSFWKSHPEILKENAKKIKKVLENKSDEEIQNSINKQWETKIKLGTASSSSIEDSIALWLDEINIKYMRNYNKDCRYPFHCDFYLPDTDYFIEIQGYWSHGGHPYDPNNLIDNETLSKWIKKSRMGHKQYTGAIHVWTETDIKKRTFAKNNSINFLEIFSINIDEIKQQILNIL